jgi:hypothetical protein
MPKKSNPIINGYKPDDNVLVFGRTPKDNKLMALRQVGIAGFYVKGLATCFYWHERGRTWDDEPKK